MTLIANLKEIIIQTSDHIDNQFSEYLIVVVFFLTKTGLKN